MLRNPLPPRSPKLVLIIIPLVFFAIIAVTIGTFLYSKECGTLLQRKLFIWHENTDDEIRILLIILGCIWAFTAKGQRIYKVIFFCLLILFIVISGMFTSVRLKTRDSRRITDIKQLQLGLELYKDRNGNYPDKLDKIEQQGLMPKIPIDPSTEQQYSYQSTGNSYALSAKLEHCSNPILREDIDPSNDTYDVGP